MATTIDPVALAHPQQDSLVVWFDPAAEAKENYLTWIEELGLPLASRDYVPTFVRSIQNGDVRLPNAREATAMACALEAVNCLIARHHRTFKRLASLPVPPEEGLLTMLAPVAGDKNIEVRWPGA